MRFPQNIAWRRCLFQAIFWLVGLALFSAQLSGKFYQRASLPVHHYAGGHRLMSGKTRRSFALTGETRENRLSMDKRYDLSAVFDLPSPLIRLVHYSTASPKAILLYYAGLDRGIPDITLLRGPPALL